MTRSGGLRHHFVNINSTTVFKNGVLFILQIFQLSLMEFKNIFNVKMTLIFGDLETHQIQDFSTCCIKISLNYSLPVDKWLASLQAVHYLICKFYLIFKIKRNEESKVGSRSRTMYP